MSTIGSSLSKGEDGTALINPAVLGQVAGLPKDLTRSAFDAAVTRERTNITNNGTGVWNNGEKLSIFGELGTRLWFVGGSAAASHARNVSYLGTTYTLGADANVFAATTGAPANTTGANGDIMVDVVAGLLYGPRASGTWPAGVSLYAGQSPATVPASSTAAGTEALLYFDPATGLYCSVTPTVLTTYMLAHDGSVDLAQATVLSALPSTGNLLFLSPGGTVQLLPVGLLGTGTPVATTFGVAASTSSIAIGASVTLTVTPGTGGWPSGEVVTPVATSVTGSFDASSKVGSGTTPVTFTFTASGSAATGTLSATAPNMTLSGSAAALATTTSAATTFAVAASSSSISIGATTTLTVTPGTGGWPSGKVVTPVATTVTGSFDASSKVGSGTTPVTFTFTASGSAATGSLSATAPGMTLSGSAAALATTAAVAATGHRYWRVNTSSCVFGNYISIAEVSMASSSGGANLLTGGTASASSVEPGGFPASCAVDGNASTWWTAANGNTSAWWAYDFGAGQAPAIAELKITARNDTAPTTAPGTFTLEWSDNGTTWHTRQGYTAATWTQGSTQTFAVPSTDATGLTMTAATYGYRSGTSGSQMLTSGYGTASVTLPSTGQFWAVVTMKTNSTADNGDNPIIRLTNAAGEWLQVCLNGGGLRLDDHVGSGQYDGSASGGDVGLTNGTVHEVGLWNDPGNQFHGYVDGSENINRNTVGGFASGGASTIYIAGRSAGVYNLRLYAGTPSAPGTLLGQWQLDGSGAAS